MTRTRHQARILALQGLYQLDVQQAPSEATIDEVIAYLSAEAYSSPLPGPPPDGVADYARRLCGGTWPKCRQYDQMIAAVSAHWDVSRMAVVDRNILRLALHELLEEPDVPARVVLDEAIEMGKEFGGADSPQFINGVLDAVWKQHPACQAARPADEPARGGKMPKPEEKNGTV